MSENQYTTEARDAKFDNEDTEGSIQTASDEMGDTDLYGVISRAVAEQLGEYFNVTVSDEAAVTASRTGETKNFGKFETPNRAAYGIGINRSVLEDVTGEELPDEVGLTFAPSTQEAYEAELEELDESAEEEAEALVAGTDDSDETEDESDEDTEAADLVEDADELTSEDLNIEPEA